MHKTPHFSIRLVTLIFMHKFPHHCVFMLIFQTQCCLNWEHHMATVHGGSGIQLLLHLKQCHSPGTLEEFKKPFLSNWSCNSSQLPLTWATPKMIHSTSLKWGKLRSSCGNEFQKLVISCRSASRIEIICACIPIPKELTWLQRLPKKVGTLRSIPLKAKDNAVCVVLEMQKSPTIATPNVHRQNDVFPARMWSLTFYRPWFKQVGK